MRVARLLALSTLTVALASLVTMWGLFSTMFVFDTTAVRFETNHYGEFWIEFVILTVGIVGLPVLVYELDETGWFA